MLKNLLKVDYKFELQIPKDKQEIPNLTFSSSEENDDDEQFEEDDDYNMYSDRGQKEKLQTEEVERDIK